MFRRRRYSSISSPAQARRAIVSGFVLLVAGVAITVGTYVWADHRGGGTYIVSWGPMVAGVVTLIRGLAAGSRVGFRGPGGSGGGLSGSGARRRGQPTWYTPAAATAAPDGFPAAGDGGVATYSPPAPPAGASAGWLSDPWDPTRLRWWDGRSWGAQTAAR